MRVQKVDGVVHMVSLRFIRDHLRTLYTYTYCGQTYVADTALDETSVPTCFTCFAVRRVVEEELAC